MINSLTFFSQIGRAFPPSPLHLTGISLPIPPPLPRLTYWISVPSSRDPRAGPRGFGRRGAVLLKERGQEFAVPSLKARETNHLKAIAEMQMKLLNYQRYDDCGQPHMSVYTGNWKKRHCFYCVNAFSSFYGFYRGNNIPQ